MISQHHQQILYDWQQQRKQRELLSHILKEQIKTNNALKEKRWNY